MSVLNDTVSILESLPESDVNEVYLFSQTLLRQHDNPFTPKSENDILNDLTISRQQRLEGKAINADDAFEKLGKKHGFI